MWKKRHNIWNVYWKNIQMYYNNKMVNKESQQFFSLKEQKLHISCKIYKDECSVGEVWDAHKFFYFFLVIFASYKSCRLISLLPVVQAESLFPLWYLMEIEYDKKHLAYLFSCLILLWHYRFWQNMIVNLCWKPWCQKTINYNKTSKLWGCRSKMK